jgi:hypothetical protein
MRDLLGVPYDAVGESYQYREVSELDEGAGLKHLEPETLPQG